MYIIHLHVHVCTGTCNELVLHNVILKTDLCRDSHASHCFLCFHEHNTRKLGHEGYLSSYMYMYLFLASFPGSKSLPGIGSGNEAVGP